MTSCPRRSLQRGPRASSKSLRIREGERHSCSPFSFVLLLIVCAGEVQAQRPIISSPVYNAASYARVLAPGSIITVTGLNLGPDQLVSASGYPLPTNLAGTSAEVALDGVAISLPILFASARQVAAVLPSRTPMGKASLAISFNGQSSVRQQFSIARAQFGIFTASSSGRGPAAAHNVAETGTVQLNTLTTPAHANSSMILYGTGLGPVPGVDDAQMPTLGEVPGVTPEVLVGGRRATVTYGGRSGCCPGLDQINFTIPADVSGCYIPVVVKVDGTLSNAATISIAPTQGTPCSDDHGRTAHQLRSAEVAGASAESNIVLRRLSATENIGLFNLPIYAETAAARFDRYSFPDLLLSTGFSAFGPPVTPGSCVTYAWGQFIHEGVAPESIDVVRPAQLNAGPSLTLTGPGGTRTLQPNGRGEYTAELTSLSGGARIRYLQPGTYSVTNGPGTAEVGSFVAQLTIPADARWTNETSTNTIVRSEGYEATWTGGDPNGFAYVAGRTAGDAGMAFTCYERASTGRLLVPAYILESLPNLSYIGVGIGTASTRFSASGLDAGRFVFIDYREKPVNVR